jgi:DNA repair exonuclease SbcCD ATPase subunit
MTAAPTPSAEEYDALEKRLEEEVKWPDTSGAPYVNDEDLLKQCLDALKALRQQVAGLGRQLGDAITAQVEHNKLYGQCSEREAELTTSRERVERLQTGIREVIPEIVKYVGHIPDRKFTIGNVIRKLEALARASDAKEGKS